MQVEVNLFGPLREAVGRKTVLVRVETGATVGDALAALVELHPALDGELLTDDGAVPAGVTVTLDGTDVGHLDGAATPVADGDVLRAAPPVVGGAASRRS